MRLYVEEIEERMDESSLEVLYEHCGDELDELKRYTLAVLAQLQGAACSKLEWNPHAGDANVLANLQDIVEAMGHLTGREVAWSSRDSSGDYSSLFDAICLPCWRATFGALGKLIFHQGACCEMPACGPSPCMPCLCRLHASKHATQKRSTRSPFDLYR